MSPDLQIPHFADFLQTNAAAVFGLLGALGGGLLSFAATWIHKRRDFDLQIWGKLFERRIAAHERVIGLAVEMRMMVTLGGTDMEGRVRRSPKILVSKDEFEIWFTRFTQSSLESTTWLNTGTKREVNLVQDYLVTLYVHLVTIPSEHYLDVGEVIRQDFIDLSSSLEKHAFAFFSRDIKKLKLNQLEDWHKYPQEETLRRLNATALLGRLDEVTSFVNR